MSRYREEAVLLCAVSTPGQAADDKDSIEAQERDLLAVAAREGWNVVDIIRVGGFSRYFYTWREFAEAAAQAGHDGPLRMFDHWKRGDFSVLAVRDGSRFGRDTSIFNEVVNRTIDANARLYTLETGWIDEQNRRLYGLVGGFMAAVERDNIVKRTAAGRRALVRRGLPSNAHTPISHRVIRDERGKVAGLEVNAEAQLLILDAVALVLEGIGWHQIGRELYRRFGHINTNGKLYHNNYWYRLFHTPAFWGHIASAPRNTHGLGCWAFDENLPVPEAYEIVRNTHPPALTGDLAEQLKAELRRRSDLMHGTRRPHNTSMFSGLLYCAGCYSTLYYRRDQRRYACCSRDRPTLAVRCERFHTVKEDVIIAFFDPLLRHMLSEHAPDLLARHGQQQDQGQLARLLAENLAAVEAQIERLIVKQAASPESVADLYDSQIAALAASREHLQQRLASAQRNADTDLAQAACAAFERLSAYGDLSVFWAEDGRVINQILHQLMGRSRLAIWRGKVEEILTPP